MLISCPKCNAVYNIADDKIPEQGRRFKCIECGNIWTVYPQDTADIEPENKIKTQKILADEEEAVKNDVQEMFQRLSRDTDSLFSGEEKWSESVEKNPLYTKKDAVAQDKETEPLAKTKRKMQVFFSPFIVNSLLFCIIVVMTILIVYNNRYQIVRFIPQMEDFYDGMHLDSVYAGNNLVFDQLEINQTEQGINHYVEISGRIYNKGSYKVKLLPIKAIMYDSNGKIAGEEIKTIAMNDIKPNTGAMFFIRLENKTADEKKINLSFVPQNKNFNGR